MDDTPILPPQATPLLDYRGNPPVDPEGSLIDVPLLATPWYLYFHWLMQNLASINLQVADVVAPEVPAPNVTATASITNRQVGSLSQSQFQGTVTLPGSDPNFSHLSAIKIVAYATTEYQEREIATLHAPFFGSTTTVNYQSTFYQQSVLGNTWNLYFYCINNSGIVTVNAFNVAAVEAAAQGAVVPATAYLTSIVGADTAVRTIDTNDQLTHTSLSAVLTQFPYAGPQFATIWVSRGTGVVNTSGVTVTWVSGNLFDQSMKSFGIRINTAGGSGVSGTDFGVTNVSADLMTLTLATSAGSHSNCTWIGTPTWINAVNISATPYTVYIDQLVPGSPQQWRLYGIMGSLPRTMTLPSGVVTSSDFGVATLGAPSGTATTGLAMSAPSYMGFNSIGRPYWMSTLTGTLPGNLDPNQWFISVTVRCCNASGVSDTGPDSNSYPVAGTVNTSGTTVVWVSGNRFTRALVDIGITITGVHYTVASVTSSVFLTLGSSAGTQTAATYTATNSEILFGEFVNDGGVLREITGGPQVLLGNYNPRGSAYTYLEMRAYATSRNTIIAPGWLDPNTGNSVPLTVAWPGSAAYQRINFGDTPYTLQQNVTDPLTLDPSLVTNNTTGNPGVNSTNVTSILWDSNFELSPTGAFQSQSPWANQFGTTTVVSGSAYTGDQFARITGYGRFKQRTTKDGAGGSWYLQFWTQNSNTTPVSLTATITFYNAAGASVGFNATTITGYQATWTMVSMFSTAPAGSTSIDVSFVSGATEGGSTTWDIDGILFQQLINQSLNGQTQTTVPVAQTAGYSAINGLIISSGAAYRYGSQQAIIVAADGGYALMSSISTNHVFNCTGANGQIAQMDAGGTHSSLSLGAATGSNAKFVMHEDQLQGVDSANVQKMLLTLTQITLNGNAGYTGTLAAAIAGGKNVQGGIIY